MSERSKAKHINRVVLAATGSGKSYFVDHDPANRIDYDVLISRTIGWSTFDKTNEIERFQAFTKNGHFFSQIPIMRTVYGMFANLEAHFQQPTDVAIVIIDDKRHKKQIEQRDRWPTIDDYDTIIQGQVGKLKEFAEKYQVPIFEDFHLVNRFQRIKCNF